MEYSQIMEYMHYLVNSSVKWIDAKVKVIVANTATECCTEMQLKCF